MRRKPISVVIGFCRSGSAAMVTGSRNNYCRHSRASRATRMSVASSGRPSWNSAGGPMGNPAEQLGVTPNPSWQSWNLFSGSRIRSGMTSSTQIRLEMTPHVYLVPRRSGFAAIGYSLSSFPRSSVGTHTRPSVIPDLQLKYVFPCGVYVLWVWSSESRVKRGNPVRSVRVATKLSRRSRSYKTLDSGSRLWLARNDGGSSRA